MIMMETQKKTKVDWKMFYAIEHDFDGHLVLMNGEEKLLSDEDVRDINATMQSIKVLYAGFIEPKLRAAKCRWKEPQ